MKHWLSIGMLFVTLFSLLACSESEHTSKYAGQENRKIKSLSPNDIEELKRGGGWGLAKAAELNGLPGPAHILEMADKIALSDKQKTAIEKIYNEMQTEAVQLGEQFIRLESELNDNFTEKTINQASLETSIQAIERVRAQLRFVHLSTHLRTPDILSEEQIALYNELRGYSKDPCQNIPEGHSEAMWKKHNGCE